MKIRLLEQITFRSEPLAAGAELDLPDVDANQLIAAGHAEAITTTETTAGPRVDLKNPAKSPTIKE